MNSDLEKQMKSSENTRETLFFTAILRDQVRLILRKTILMLKIMTQSYLELNDP
jgi:hypothetical protein